MESLREALKYRGFGDSMNAELEQQMKSGAADFQLFHGTKIGNDDISFRLHFRKDNNEDRYYFNKFDTLLQPAGKPDQAFEHTFYADQHITAKEAYNLLTYGEKTAVYKTLYNKENEPYNAWITLDVNGQKDKSNNFPLNKYHDSYYKKQPFVLKEELKNLSVPVKEIEEGRYLDNMERSLKRGNAVNVTIMHNGQEQAGILLVNAKAGRVDVYDDSMQLTEKKAQTVAQAPVNAHEDVKKKSWNNREQVNWANKPSTRKGMTP